MDDLLLRDIHAAPPPPWWPPAPGWWLLALALLTLAVFAGGRLAWAHYRWRRRRWSLAQLQSLHTAWRRDGNAQAFAAEVSVLLRRVALSCFEPNTVAALTAQPWLDFLDRTGGAGQFGNGPGQSLLTAPYARISELDGDALYRLAGAWIKHNL